MPAVVVAGVLLVAPSYATDFVVVVHGSAPETALGRSTVSDLFLRRTAHFSDGRRAQPVDQETDLMRQTFYRLVHGQPASAISNHWLERAFANRDDRPPRLPSDEAVLDYVASHPGGIGYVSATTALGGGVKPVRLKPDLDVIDVSGAKALMGTSDDEGPGKRGPKDLDPRVEQEQPRMNVRGFASASFGRPSGEPNSFGVGALDVFVASRLSERFRAVAEIALKADSENTVAADIERALIEYTPGPALTLGAGRFHTGLGYYTAHFHHGSWFQVAIDRPRLFAFEDEEGVLPTHNVGVSAQGKIPSGRTNLSYRFEIGNGRASLSDESVPIQTARDENSTKSLTLGLRSNPDSIPGLELGVSLYLDRLYPFRAIRVHEQILAAHIVYDNFGTQVLGEVVTIRHRVDGVPATKSNGFYAQLSQAFGKLRPYGRLERLKIPATDPYFERTGERLCTALGVRVDVSAFVAVKAQVERVRAKGEDTTIGLLAQVAFMF